MTERRPIILLIEEGTTGSGSSRHMLLSSLAEDLTLESVRGLSNGWDRLGEDNVDAVILDVGTVSLLGPGAIRKTQANAPSVPILVLGDLETEAASARCLQAGAQDFLVSEQLTRATLSAAIRYAMERQRRISGFGQSTARDELTGLPKRAAFLEQVNDAMDRARLEPAQRFALLILGLDRFNLINDSMGHEFGDQVLVALTKRIHRYLRPGDHVARISGDEFAILLRGPGEAPQVRAVIQCLQQEARSPIRYGGHEVFTTASGGLAFSDSHYEHPEEILRDASIALHQAKSNGKGLLEIYESRMHAEVLDQFELEMEMRRAIQTREFLLHYQPIIDLHTRKLIGFEALLRWDHPRRGLVPPGQFIPLAEETGLIVPIERWVFRHGAEQIRQWRKLLPVDHPLSLSVNLSGKHLALPDVAAEIKTLLEECDLDPRWFRIEITESVVVENSNAAVMLLSELRELGTPLAIDDFGTGYSSLACLHRFPLDMLKIDRSFVRPLTEEPRNAEMIRTILRLAECFDLSAVVEGIETAEQLELLVKLGCRYGQGFYFSRPVSAHAAEALVLAAAQGATMPLHAVGEERRRNVA